MKKTIAALLIAVIYTVSTMVTLLVNNMFEQVMGRLSVVMLALIIYITIVWALSQTIRRLDCVDIAWGGGFIIAAVMSLTLNPYGISFGWNVQTITTMLIIVWAMRLSWYLLRRILAHGEDARYQAIRASWKGSAALNAYYKVFLTQGVLMMIASIAVIHINLSPSADIGVIAVVGAGMWTIGFLLEAIGDYQLKVFLAVPDNKGLLMTQGLWRYTRHPNYFGESVQWWGIFVIGLSTMYGWVGVITPLVVTYLLLFVSGVAINEKRHEGRNGWSDYKRRTSMFIPMPPKISDS